MIDPVTEPESKDHLLKVLLQDKFWRLHNLYWIKDKDGNKVSVTKVYDPRLMLAWLKRLERDKWGDKLRVDQKVSGTVEHRTPITQVPREARNRLRDALDALPDVSNN